ncbi:LPS-assembly lipoprotein LptE [Gilvimarinus agarilyticus]|uniref:LPS-assembly lipoprotein LptE n=1 Tax=Gilvimarinus agarilyticus TaxID=679259 RepID=UPI0005A092FD|nr:LPS assembly lipoprotein LptE [Gilvimarinus agarilyticus]
MKALILSLSLLLLTSACGWHLRGSLNPPLDIERIYVVSTEEHTELLRELERSLASQDIDIVDRDENPEYILALGDETTRRRTVGIGADTLASAYSITLMVQYQILTTDNVPLGEQEQARVTRTYDATDSTGLEREEEILMGEMRIDLVQQMMRRAYILLQNDDSGADGETTQ